ncbi:MAG: chemotaxis protein CheX [Campylobacterota bacterium]|nr:chemotaxis protein CheX [Campylobacterota bacterium]
MIEYISTATENFFQHQMGTTCQRIDHNDKLRTVIAYIDINSSINTKHRIYIAMQEALLQQIIELFLGEENSDERTLTEMSLETSNMIIGSAKVLAEGSNSEFTIETPFSEGVKSFNMAYDEKHTFEINNNTFIVATKEL